MPPTLDGIFETIALETLSFSVASGLVPLWQVGVRCP